MTDEAYITAADARSYSRLRQLDLSVIKDDDHLTALLLRASELIDSVCEFAGSPMAKGQKRAWPRRDVIKDGEVLDGVVPAEVTHAVMTLALRLATDQAEALRLIGLQDRISSERIGGIHIRYQSDTQNLPPLLRGLLPYLKVADSTQKVRRA